MIMDPSDSVSDAEESLTSVETNSLARKTILVTGSAGFIGSHVSDILLARGDKVIGIDE